MKRNKSHELDILNGPILNKFFIFMLPIALGSILQLLFNAADIIIVGQFAGAKSLAAVGATTALVNLYLQLYIGLATGVNIEVARAYATGNKDRISKIVHSAIGLSLCGGIIFLLIGLTTAKALLRLTGTPSDIIEQSALYLYIWCLGIPASVLYNFGAAILRSIGDTKRPTFYLIISGLVNLILNIISVIVLQMGVAGVAIATSISNYVSAFLIASALLREESAVKVQLSKISLDKVVITDIIQLGIPIAVQNSLFTIPNMLIQSAVNSFGSTVVAANAASQSIEGIQFAMISANSISAATFISQHYAAGKYKRADHVLSTILISSTIVSLCIGGLLAAFRQPVLSLYNTDPEVIAIGSTRLVLMVMTDFLDEIMCIFSNALRGMGKSIAPTVITLIFVAGFRAIWLLLIFPFVRTYVFVLLSWPISWIMAVPALYIYYRRVRKTYPLDDLNSPQPAVAQ